MKYLLNIYGIFNWANETQTTEQVKKLLLATVNEGGTFFNSAAILNKLRVFQGIFDLAKEILTTDVV